MRYREGRGGRVSIREAIVLYAILCPEGATLGIAHFVTYSVSTTDLNGYV
jgi:hypothetical protein